MEKNIYDFIIVGGGIGGCSIALKLESKYNILLIEKESILGGCSGSFTRKDMTYNIGATTFATYQPNLPVYEFFKNFNLNFNIIKSNPSVTVLMGDKKIHRYEELDLFIKDINKNFYHPNNEKFWTKVKEVSDLFYKKSDLFYDKSQKIKTIYHISKSIFPFSFYFLLPAHIGLKLFLPNISKEYLDFIDNQVLIVAQSKSNNLNFLTLILSLGYSLYDNYYAIGGMTYIFEEISKHISNIKLNTHITNIDKKDDIYKLTSDKNESFYAKNIILNKPIFKQKPNLYTNQSAFMVYMKIKTRQKLEHHYQIISKQTLPFCISNSIFVSISDSSDNIMAPDGYHSVTISTHTLVSIWDNLSKEAYKSQKIKLQEHIKELFLSHFPTLYDSIEDIFSATPNTFGRYIKRKTLGGIPLSFRNIVFNTQSPKISDSCYYVGDTIFPAQGWPGVVIGANNLYKVIQNG